MKQITILLILVLSLSEQLMSQDFSFDPVLKEFHLEYDNDILYQLKVITDDGPAHAQLNLNTIDGPLVRFYLSDGEGGQLVLSNNDDPHSPSIFNQQFLSFQNGEDPVYRMSRNDGFQAFDNSGNVTVQIRGDVSGDGRVSTNELEITGGSDLSEHFDITNTDMEIEPGMLVSISGKEGKLSITNYKRDKKVVGVISGANGIETGMLMGQKGSIADGDYPIALTGRTYVYVNTENGAIEPGDFITSSSTPGYGMKVMNHRKSQGAIIGKAMTTLESGSGYVLVLVNLQ